MCACEKGKKTINKLKKKNFKFLVKCARKEMNVNEIWQLYIGSKIDLVLLCIFFAHGGDRLNMEAIHKYKEYKRIDVLF